jgi:hypothetical protein
MRRRSAHDLVPLGVVIMVAGATLVLLLVYPVLLSRMSERSFDWPRLSEVGEAYGGVGPIVSSLAFCAIALSLLLQWRQNRMTLLFSNRQLHLDLIKLALADREFLYVDGSVVADDPDAVRKVYANLLVGHWATAWDLRTLDVANLRSGAARLFESELAREWWQASGSSYSSSRRRRRFVEIIDDEYGRAVTTGPGSRFDAPPAAYDPAAGGLRSPASKSPRRAWRAHTAVGLLGMAVGAAVVTARHRAQQRRRGQDPRA